MRTAHKVVLGLLIAILPTGVMSQNAIKAIRCGVLIDVVGGRSMKNVTVIVRDDTIAAVGTDVAIPDGAEIIDLSSATVLPGMVDLHCHFLGFEDEGGRGSSADNALGGVKNAEKVLLSGFTTIRDPGGGDANYANFAVRDAINRGLFPGPRIFAAGRFLSITGGHGDWNNVAPERETHRENIVDGVEEMRRAVRRDAKFGCDWIKLYGTGGFFSAGDDPTQQHFSDEEMRVAVEEASRLGKYVAVHAHGAQGIKAAVKAGVRTIEHGTFIDDEGIELMKKHGTFLVPTMRTIEVLADDPGPDASAGRRKAYELSKKHFNTMIANINKAVKRGVKVAFGSDMVSMPHGLAAQEFPLHVKAGQSPMEAIQSGTTISAQALALDDRIGSIAVGKYADIIAVAGNPLENILLLQNVAFVMKAGVVYKNVVAVK
ncbi:MAG: amidohydrolase family protein [Bacteroidota bacterium]